MITHMSSMYVTKAEDWHRATTQTPGQATFCGQAYDLRKNIGVEGIIPYGPHGVARLANDEGARVRLTINTPEEDANSRGASSIQNGNGSHTPSGPHVAARLANNEGARVRST